jgi:hypothetical protein
MMVVRDGLGEAAVSWATAGVCVLVLFFFLSKYLFLFGFGVVVGLLIAYEFAHRWIGCLL